MGNHAVYSSAGRTVAYVSLIVLLIYYHLVLIFTTCEFQGKDVGDGLNTRLVFGTGVYYVLLMACPAIFLTGVLMGGHYDAVFSKGDEKAMFIYPQYQWNMWMFFYSGYALWIIQCVLLIIFMVTYGWNADVNMGGVLSFSDMKILRFRTNTLFIIISSLVMIILSYVALHTYVLKAFPVKSIKEIKDAIDNMVKVNRRKA